MRLRAAQPRSDRGVAVGVGDEAGADLRAPARVAAVAPGVQRGLDARVGRAGVHPRRVAQRVGQRRFERAGVDDVRELLDPLLPGREAEQAAGCVAADAHLGHRRGRRGGQLAPDAQALQERYRGRVQGVGAQVGGLRRAGGWRGGCEQGDFQALRGQFERQRAPDDAGAVDRDVAAIHRSDCRQAPVQPARWGRGGCGIMSRCCAH